MATLHPEFLAELRHALAEGTPAPWDGVISTGGLRYLGGPVGELEHGDDITPPGAFHRREDAHLAALARNALSTLLNHIDTLERRSLEQLPEEQEAFRLLAADKGLSPEAMVVRLVRGQLRGAWAPVSSTWSLPEPPRCLCERSTFAKAAAFYGTGGWFWGWWVACCKTRPFVWTGPQGVDSRHMRDGRLVESVGEAWDWPFYSAWGRVVAVDGAAWRRAGVALLRWTSDHRLEEVDQQLLDNALGGRS